MDAKVAAWLEASCAQQGVPLLVTDPEILSRVAALLVPADSERAHRAAEHARRRTA